MVSISCQYRVDIDNIDNIDRDIAPRSVYAMWCRYRVDNDNIDNIDRDIDPRSVYAMWCPYPDDIVSILTI